MEIRRPTRSGFAGLIEEISNSVERARSVKCIKIGIRPSALALKQAYEAIEIMQKVCPDHVFNIRVIETQGDKDKKTPLTEVSDSDFFTREIDQALLKGDIDFGVHSSKDLPEVMPSGLKVIFETESVSRFDCLVSKGGFKLKDLPTGWRVGISSRRRKDSVMSLRQDLAIRQIRGNIDERLALIDSGYIDALIVAHAALIRLGYLDKISEVFPLDVFKTHARQGMLSIVGRIRN